MCTFSTHVMPRRRVFSKTYCKPNHRWRRPIVNINRRCFRSGAPKRTLKKRLARILKGRELGSNEYDWKVALVRIGPSLGCVARRHDASRRFTQLELMGRQSGNTGD